MTLHPCRPTAIFAVFSATCALLTSAIVSAADTVVTPNDVRIRPGVSFQAAALRVTGPGDLFIERRFDASGTIALANLDDRGNPLPDGEYRWSLTLTPVLTAEVREQLARARELGDDAVVADLRSRGVLPPAEDLVSSGVLRVSAGSFVVPGGVEAPAAGASSSVAAKDVAVDQDGPGEDQVIADDLIVQGSACVGVDCVNNENFGFDTIRLKENNLRIGFDDTSTTAGFPANDWQLTANDSASGGANKFSIDDISNSRTPFTVSAGARTNALFVHSSGQIGFGTSTPVVALHTQNGNTPTLRLEQDGSSGFTPQTWDIAGNEANFFVRDVTGGSRLPFRIRPGAPTSSLDIAASGNVGIGTASPSARLHVVTATGAGAVDSILLENNAPSRLKLRNTAIAASFTQDPDWVLNSNGTFRISAGADAAELTLDAAGNLTVIGSYRVNSTTLNVPDFVFEPSYDLMSLDQVDGFIREHRHLPGIPSAAQIARDGLDLTDMQLKLLQKVEELTLYAIEQQRVIEQLQARLAATDESR